MEFKFKDRAKVNINDSSKKLKAIQLVLFIIIFFIFNFFALVPLHPSFIWMFWMLLLFMILRIFISNNKKIGVVGIVLISVGFFAPIIASPIFHATEYKELIGEVETEVYTEDVEAAQIEQLPIVDQELAQTLGDKKLGEVSGLGSQYHVGTMNMISVNGELLWVAPLEPNDPVKWFATGGVSPGYITVSATNPNDVELVTEINGQPLSIKYTEESYLMGDINRYAYYRGSMFKGLTDFTFELDDEGNPYWVITKYEKTIAFFGGDDVESIIIIDAQTGEVVEYLPEEAPLWVDRVYPQELVHNQLQYYGLYGNGFINSIFAQKGVIQPTGQGSYLYYGGECYFYVGMTSVASDQSTVGFMLVNTRTGQTTYYPLSGATETAAMQSAQGAVQDLGYIATYPIIINLEGEPTYFMTLKDDSGLVKQYAFVNVENVSVVGVGATVLEAQNNYLQILYDSGTATFDTSSQIEQAYTIERIDSEVVSGETYYSFTVSGSDKIFVAPSSLSDELVLTQPGDTITIKYVESENSTINIQSFENTSF